MGWRKLGWRLAAGCGVKSRVGSRGAGGRAMGLDIGVLERGDSLAEHLAYTPISVGVGRWVSGRDQRPCARLALASVIAECVMVSYQFFSFSALSTLSATVC